MAETKLKYEQAIQNKYILNAYANADLSVNNATTVSVPLNTEVIDTNNNFDTSTYTYTVPITGYYFISWSVALGDATGITGEVAYLKVDTTQTQYAIGGNLYNIVTMGNSGIFYLTSGAAVKLEFYNGSGGTRVIKGVRRDTMLTIFLLTK